MKLNNVFIFLRLNEKNMKKYLVPIFFILISNICLADQLAYITLSQAKKAKTYLKTTDYLILWCACCENDVAEGITTDNVYYKKVNYKDYYQVVLEGKNQDGKYVSRDLDLAYVHSLENGFYKSVGKILNYECDPCTEPFELSNKDEGKDLPNETMKFIITDASINGVDTTPTLLAAEAYSVFYTVEDSDLIYMANVWSKNDSQSYGPMYYIKKKEETYEEYKADFFYFNWRYMNDYDDKKGTATVQLIKIFKPQGITFILKIIPENLDVIVYKGYIEGSIDFSAFD